MHRIVAPWLPEERGEAEERAFYAVAAMIADRPRHSFTTPDTDADETTPEPDGQDLPAAGNEPKTSSTAGKERNPQKGGSHLREPAGTAWALPSPVPSSRRADRPGSVRTRPKPA